MKPAVVTQRNVARFKSQLQALGLSFDWSREINTTDPSYYKWTQWFSSNFLRRALAYKKEMSGQLVPLLQGGFANEEATGGRMRALRRAHDPEDQKPVGAGHTKYAQR